MANIMDKELEPGLMQQFGKGSGKIMNGYGEKNIKTKLLISLIN